MVLAAGCDRDAAPPLSEVGVSRNPAGELCARPEPGCTCESNSAPVTCYGPPITLGGMLQCNVGSLYCRDGRWSDCETVASFAIALHDSGSEIGSSSSALISGPDECNPCNPDCYESRDEPTDPADLTSSDMVELASGVPTGVTLIADFSALVDMDSDGVPDYWDNYPNDPDQWHDDPLAVHVTLPYLGAPENAEVNFSVSIRAADVYFLIDVTASMNEEIDNLKASLTSGTISGYEMGGPRDECGGAAVGNGVIGAVQCQVPDTWFGVGYFGDLPIYPYGNAMDYSGADRDEIYAHVLDVTSDTMQAQNAIDALETGDGGDLPESHTQALWALASGNGFDDGYHEYLAPRTAPCAEMDAWGYPCFREDPIPIVVIITDAQMHNGPDATYDYGFPVHVNVPDGNYDTAAPFEIAQDLSTAYLEVHGDTSTAMDDESWWNLLSYTGASCYSNGPDQVLEFTVSDPAASLIFMTYQQGTDYNSSIRGLFTVSGDAACDDDYRIFLGPSAFGYLSGFDGTYQIVVDGLDATSLGFPSDEDGNYSLLIGDPSVPNQGITALYSDALTELNAQGIKTVGISSCNGGGGSDCPGDGYSDLVALGNATGSVDAMGAPFVVEVGSDGSGVSEAVVDAIYDLASSFRVDVDAIAIDNPDTVGFDERDFVESITVEMCPAECLGSIAQGCAQCLPDSMLDFTMVLENDVVMPTTEPQYYEFEILVRADYGSFTVARFPVYITIPPEGPIYPDEGTYWRDYDATDSCAIPPTRPDWGEFIWDVTTPDSAGASSTVTFEFQAAETEAGLDTAPIVSFIVPPQPDSVMAGSGIDIGQLLIDNGSANFLPYLRTTATLSPSPDGQVAPILTSFEISYLCADVE